jgi:hypothetical protein
LKKTQFAIHRTGIPFWTETILSADDILYSPINNTQQDAIDQALIAQIALCMGDPNSRITFTVSDKVSLPIYERVAEIIDNDPIIQRAAAKFCQPDGLGLLRPNGSITMAELFGMLHRDLTHTLFYWTSKGSASGVEQIVFDNNFSIICGIPSARMADGREFEWWVLSLMAKFAGFHGFYIFTDQNAARSYWNSP